MRIGVDARELQGRPTGTGRYLRSLLRAWPDGSDQLVLYFAGPPPEGGLPPSPGTTTRALGAARGLVWQERLLPAAARGDALDVFFSPAYLCPLRLDLPRVTAVHDVSFFAVPHDFAPLDGLRRRVLVARSLHASTRVLACSDFTRREIGARFPELAARVVHVPLGPDDDLPAPVSREAARRRLGLARPLLLAVGSILNRRCLPELLRAVALLARRGLAVELDVVGENRTHPPRDFHAEIAALGLAERVRLSGYATEAGLAERYAAADALVCLSEYEGFGLPALEAMARGVPVIASARPSLGEVFGEAALLVEPRDVSGIAAAVFSVLTDPGLCAALVSRGRALVRRFSWTETASLTRQALVAAAGE